MGHLNLKGDRLRKAVPSLITRARDSLWHRLQPVRLNIHARPLYASLYDGCGK
jgi:hypothetical protein